MSVLMQEKDSDSK